MQEIVWCNQLVVRLAGLLIDIAQPDLGREGVTALMQQAVQSGVAAAAGWHADIVAASDGAQTPVQMLFEHARSQAPSRFVQIVGSEVPNRSAASAVCIFDEPRQLPRAGCRLGRCGVSSSCASRGTQASRWLFRLLCSLTISK